MIYLAFFLLFCLGWYIGHRITRPKILKPDNPNRPFTSDELRQLGIVLPDPTTYDCETFVR
jgi:hypothetical protein